MEKAKVNGIQLFLMMFMLGAKKDAWLAILLGMSIGFGLFLFTIGYFVIIQNYLLLVMQEKY